MRCLPSLNFYEILSKKGDENGNLCSLFERYLKFTFAAIDFNLLVYILTHVPLGSIKNVYSVSKTWYRAFKSEALWLKHVTSKIWTVLAEEINMTRAVKQRIVSFFPNFICKEERLEAQVRNLFDDKTYSVRCGKRV